MSNLGRWACLPRVTKSAHLPRTFWSEELCGLAAPYSGAVAGIESLARVWGSVLSPSTGKVLCESVSFKNIS